MADPINKTMLDEVEARLKQITIANGYTFDLVTVDRARMTPWDTHDLPGCNYWPTNLGNEVAEFGGDSRVLNLMVEIHSVTRDEPFTDVCDRFGKDLVTALNRATSAPAPSDTESIDLGGLVDDLIFQGYDYNIGKGQEPFFGILAQFLVRYNATLNEL